MRVLVPKPGAPVPVITATCGAAWAAAPRGTTSNQSAWQQGVRELASQASGGAGREPRRCVRSGQTTGRIGGLETTTDETHVEQARELQSAIECARHLMPAAEQMQGESRGVGCGERAYVQRCWYERARASPAVRDREPAQYE